MNKKEAHVFIIWSKGLQHRHKILVDIGEKFEILNIVDVTWSQNKFSENLSRFYGENLPKNSSKEKHCGTGMFLCVIVRDEDPVYDMRETSKGVKVVNVNMFDAKKLYRCWTGGGHKIHGSDNVTEAKYNIYLLFGKKYSIFVNSNERGVVTTHNQDLIGACGWNSLEDIFEAFNELSNYVVLRNFDNIEEELINLHPDIDLLTDNKRLVADISNGKPTYKDRSRVQHLVFINGQRVFFDLRFIGDNYYDCSWENSILRSKVKYKNMYVPNPENHLFSLIYHAFVHKHLLVEDYVIKLIDLSQNVGLNWVKESFIEFKILDDLNEFMCANHYAFVEPRDLTVYFNTAMIEKYGCALISPKRVMHDNIRALKVLVVKVFRKMGIELI